MTTVIPAPDTPRPFRPLNILQIALRFDGWGGTEFHILALSQELMRRGHTVTIACYAGSFMERQAVERGIGVTTFASRQSHDWANFGPLLAAMRGQHFDVLHAHTQEDYVVAPAAARLRGVPAIIGTLHMPFLAPLPHRAMLRGEHAFHRILTVSDDVRTRLIVAGLDPMLLQTIHHGTDVDTFAATDIAPEALRAEWKVPPGHLVVGVAGRVSQEKGILHMLEALATMKDQPVHGVVIGAGPQEAKIRSAIRRFGLSKKTTMAGFYPQVNNAVNALDIVLLPSVWAEPCSAVVQQGMALGKPVIGTQIGGTPEMIVHSVTGLLVPPGDSPAIAGALRTLAADPDLRARMGEAGRKRVREKFTLGQMVDKVEAVYLGVEDCSPTQSG